MVLGILAGDRRPVAVAASEDCSPPSAGQSAEIEGLSTTGASCRLPPRRAIASHSAAASFPADGLDAAMAGMAAGHLDGVLGPGQPGFLATGTAHRTPGRAQGGRIDGVRCCTMGANDVHGAQFHSVFVFQGLSGCYIATVNESETITAAKPFCPVRARTSGLRAQGSGQPRFGPGFRFKSGVSGHGPCRASSATPMSSGAELGSVRKCRFAVRARPGDFARPVRS